MFGKFLRITALFITLALWAVCFALNVNAAVLQGSGLKLLLSAILFVLLILLSFLFGKYRGYYFLASGYFGVVSITSLSAFLMRESHSVWKHIFLDLPGLSFLVPFTPVFYLHSAFQKDWAPFVLILIIYGCISAAYVFARHLIKRGNKPLENTSRSQGGT